MKLGIIGTRGVPNHHGGFEQFAEYFSVYAAQHGWDVSVYNSSLHPYQEFETGNVQMLIDKLEVLINNESLRESMGVRGYKKATEQFTLENYTQSILNIYSEIIEENI